MSGGRFNQACSCAALPAWGRLEGAAGLKGNTAPPLPPLRAQVRFSWATCNPILDARAVPVKWECEEEGGQQQLNFGNSSAKAVLASSGAGRHSYFRARKLQRVQGGF